MSLWKDVPAFYDIIIRKAGGKREQNSVCSVCAKLRLLWQPESGPVPVAMAEDDWVMTFIQHQEMFSILGVRRHSGGKVCHKWKAVKAFIVKRTCLLGEKLVHVLSPTGCLQPLQVRTSWSPGDCKVHLFPYFTWTQLSICRPLLGFPFWKPPSYGTVSSVCGFLSHWIWLAVYQTVPSLIAAVDCSRKGV